MTYSSLEPSAANSSCGDWFERHRHLAFYHPPGHLGSPLFVSRSPSGPGRPDCNRDKASSSPRLHRCAMRYLGRRQTGSFSEGPCSDGPAGFCQPLLVLIYSKNLEPFFNC